MGWFDEQIKQRKINDEAAFSEAFAQIGDAIMGQRVRDVFADDHEKAKDVAETILRYYHAKIRELPENITRTDDALEYLCRPNGIMYRNVELKDKWYKTAIGAYLATFRESGEAVALVPDVYGMKYMYVDEKTGKKMTVNKKTARLFDTDAICFYKPLPLRKISAADLIKYGVSMWSLRDIVLPLALVGIVTVVGLFTPKLDYFLFSEVASSGNITLLISTLIMMICLSLAGLLLNAFHQLVKSASTIKTSVSVEAAVMMRILSLPADFFKQYSSGEISSRSQYVSVLCSTIIEGVAGTGVVSLFSLLYITQIALYAPSLTVPAIVITLLTVVYTIVTSLVRMNISKMQMELSAKESGMSYSMITGIQKIKLAGAEKRAFARWANLYAKEAKLLYSPPMFLRLSNMFDLAIELVGIIVMYFCAVKGGVSVAEYYAFSSAYAMISAAFMSLANMAVTIADIKPILEMTKPVLDAVPEVSEGKQVITRLSGNIELDNVYFRYTDNMPYILNGMSLKIRSGQYVAIVGKTGCGKSTLMRILLGFETPEKGAVYYDGKDMKNCDLKSLRKNIGTVIQNGKLFMGDIYSNITISAPQLTLDEAWEAAETAGIADDIRDMPMGMQTLISEGMGGVSGGQKQRLMIARAIAPKPKILMFDEATSALDNITQKKVSEALDKLKCTRIVIAHRLSTIKNCDRIIYLEDGKIAEDGTYEELIAQKGKFAELVERQRIDSEG